MPRRKSAEIKEAIAAHIKQHRFDARPAFYQQKRSRKPSTPRLIAYDLETTTIKAGTVEPLYITAHGEDFSLSSAVAGTNWHDRRISLCRIIRAQFLHPEFYGTYFVAWNANRFDAYLIAAALIDEPDLLLYPYMTRTNALRGLRIILRENQHEKKPDSWQFLDGIAMTGLVGTKLADFAANFAPQFPKIINAIDFEKESFDAKSPIHRAYAYRDSEALWHGITHAQQIMIDTFDQPLGVTMGGSCIKIFQAHIPRDVSVEALQPDLRDIVSQYVMRGGYCFCVKRYQGPVWKYDINQAYASAMREAHLPCGSAIHVHASSTGKSRNYVARVTGSNARNKIPFYYRSIDERGKFRSLFSLHEISETWLTSIEIEQLRLEGWRIDIAEFWAWPGEGFTMQEYVDKLEHLRMTCAGGPKGAIGTMIKATGNHSYGKTVEEIAPIEYILARECPEDAAPLYEDDDLESNPIEHVFYRLDSDRKPKSWHQPHIGAWITAHVRMVVRRAALADPDAWLYADTDCVIFSKDVTDKLDIHPSRYGAWKVEESGTEYQIIAKKVYTEIGEGKLKRSAKGLHVKQLTAEDFQRWFAGDPPEQDQVQIQNFTSVMSGGEMYVKRTRKGTSVK